MNTAVRTLLLLVLLGATALGQEPPFPIPGMGPSKRLELAEATLEPATGPAGGERTLVLSLWCEQGWHVYGSMEEVGEAPVISLASGGPATANGETQVPLGMPHESYGVTSFWVEGAFELRLPIKVADALEAGEHELSGRVDYTVCNQSTCLPPDSLSFVVDLVVAEGEQEAVLDGDSDEADEDESDWTAEDHWYFEEDHEVGIYEASVDPSDLRPGGTTWLELKVKVSEGWHVYGEKETIGLKPRLIFPDEKPFELVGEPELPDGELHDVAGLDTYWVEGGFVIRQKIRAGQDLMDNVFDVAGQLEYMACDHSTCLPPKTLDFSSYFSVSSTAPVPDGEGMAPESDGAAEGAAGDGSAGGGETDEEPPPEDDLLAFLLAAVGAGIFALSMPCTYPMIPITISFFTKQAESKGGSALGLSVVYGIGIVLMFIVIGVVFGSVIIPFAQHWVTNLIIGLVFVLFAFSLFGLYTLEPPKFLMNAAGKAQTTDGLVGVLLMGAALVITSFTCSAPFIGTLLAFGTTGEDVAFLDKALRVTMGMTVFGLTMAIPFVILSLLPGKASRMPKAGAWMNTAKVFFGFVELAAALKFFSNAELAQELYILPKWLFLGAWAALFGAGGLFLMGAFGGAPAGNRQRFAGALVLVFAHYCTWGAAGGWLDDKVMIPLAPPYESFGSAHAASADVATHSIVEDDFQLARQRAIDEKKILLVNFTGVT